MPIVNLGFQCAGVMQKKMNDDFEMCIASCKKLKELGVGCLQVEGDVAESLSQTIELLNSISKCLQLHGKNFDVLSSATECEMIPFGKFCF